MRFPLPSTIVFWLIILAFLIYTGAIIGVLVVGAACAALVGLDVLWLKHRGEF